MEIRPFPYAGILAVSPDEPLIPNAISSCNDAAGLDGRDARVPQECHTLLRCLIKKQLVKVNAP
jgi:hypothetical protein